MPEWPGPIRAARRHLPEEMRLLRGGLGLVGGVALVFGTFVQLLGGNWQLGFRHDWFLTAIFFGFIAGAVGVVSPLWYWLGRPVWHRLRRPGNNLVGRWREAQFLLGLAGAVLGLVLLFPVSATSRLPEQILFPLGLLVGIAAPLWYWVGRPIAGARLHQLPVVGPWFVEESGASQVKDLGRRLLPVIGALLLASAAVTAAIALPVAAMGEPVDRNGVAVTVAEPRTVSAITTPDGGTVSADHIRAFLLIRVTVTNQAGSEQPLPGAGAGDITHIAAACQANNFGEPSNNCNQVYLDGPFSAGGVDYVNFADEREAAGGRIGPGRTVDGWLAFRIEGSSPEEGFEPMVIVDGVGRWTLGEDGVN